jgi:hypothetical protein
MRSKVPLRFHQRKVAEVDTAQPMLLLAWTTMLTTDQKGTIAELMITNAALKLGVDVYRPCFAGGRYDLIFSVGRELLRIQCKWATLKDDVITIRCYSSRRGSDGYIKRSYSSSEIDALAAYCAELDSCFLVPISRIDGRPTVHLRVAPARNNQVRGVNFAEDFEFAATLRSLLGP